MIITCESCKISYMVPANAVGANGRNVKCAKCSHVWFAKPKPEEISLEQQVADRGEVIRPIPTGSSLPVVFGQNNYLAVKIAPYMLGVLLITATCFFHSNLVMKALPFTKGIFKSFGIYSTKNTSIADIKFRRVTDFGKNNVIIEGKLANLNSIATHYPIVRIQVLNHDHKILALHDIKNDNQSLGPNQFLPLDASITHLPADAEFLTVSIGNKVDLMFR